MPTRTLHRCGHERTYTRLQLRIARLVGRSIPSASERCRECQSLIAAASGRLGADVEALERLHERVREGSLEP